MSSVWTKYDSLARSRVRLYTEILESGRCLRLAVAGKSMGRAIVQGDRVVIEPVHPACLGIGDLIFYTNQWGHPVLHRLVARSPFWKKSGLLYAKGDACPNAEGPILPRRIMGRARKLEKKGARARNLDTGLWKLVNRFLGWWHLAKLVKFRLSEATLSKGMRA